MRRYFVSLRNQIFRGLSRPRAASLVVPLVVILGSALLGSCGHTSHQPGVLHLAQQSDCSTLDPALAYDTTSIPFVRLLYRGLVTYDAKANIINDLAERREMSKDGKTYTFWLRKDVKYHDGEPLRATDVRFAIERVTDPATASDGQSFYTTIIGSEDWTKDRKKKPEDRKLKHMAGIELVGDHEIVFHLTRPDATFLNYLALPFAFPISEAWVNKVGPDGLSEHPNGTGPYKLADWVHDGWLTLVKNPDFFIPGMPKNNRIELRFGIATNLQQMLFEQGQLDIVDISDAFPPEFTRMLGSKWKPDIIHAPRMDIRYLALNTELKPFTDKRVRQAFNYAIDRDHIVALLTGRATKARGALPPGMPAYNSKLFQYPYDPDKARQLLKEAGYKNDPIKPLTLDFSDGEIWYPKGAKLIQADLKAVGVDIVLKQARYSEVKTKAGTRKKSQMSILGWIQDFPDPSNFLDVCFNKRQIADVASINRAFYANDKVSAQLDKAAIETDHVKRRQMYEDIEKEIVDDAPWVFLLHTERYVVSQPWTKGFEMTPAWSAVYETVTVN